MSITDQTPTDIDRALIMAAAAAIEVATNQHPIAKLVTRGVDEPVSLVVLSFLVPNDQVSKATGMLSIVLDELAPAFDSIERVDPGPTN